MCRSVEGLSAVDSGIRSGFHEHSKVSMVAASQRCSNGSSIGVEFLADAVDVAERWRGGELGQYRMRHVLGDVVPIHVVRWTG